MAYHISHLGVDTCSWASRELCGSGIRDPKRDRIFHIGLGWCKTTGARPFRDRRGRRQGRNPRLLVPNSPNSPAGHVTEPLWGNPLAQLSTTTNDFHQNHHQLAHFSTPVSVLYIVIPSTGDSLIDPACPMGPHFRWPCGPGAACSLAWDTPTWDDQRQLQLPANARRPSYVLKRMKRRTTSSTF